jgi:hypothetical protein
MSYASLPEHKPLSIWLQATYDCKAAIRRDLGPPFAQRPPNLFLGVVQAGKALREGCAALAVFVIDPGHYSNTISVTLCHTVTTGPQLTIKGRCERWFALVKVVVFKFSEPTT